MGVREIHDKQKGIPVQGRGKHVGVLTGTHTPCTQEGCRGERLYVKWPDGKLTKPCTKGMTFDFERGCWSISHG